MRIGGHVNLKIAHLRQRLFGPGRFRPTQGKPLRLPHVAGADRGKRIVGAYAARPVAMADRFGAPQPVSSVFKAQPWPYDTAFPAALPEITTHPGQRLSDLPSAGAQLAKSRRPDNPLTDLAAASPQSAKPYTADHLGNLIDVWA